MTKITEANQIAINGGAKYLTYYYWRCKGGCGYINFGTKNQAKAAHLLACGSRIIRCKGENLYHVGIGIRVKIGK